MTDEELFELGFVPLKHYTIGNSLIYQLSKKRQLALSCRRTPNEMLFLCEMDEKDTNEVSDLVCLSNYDYNGYLTLDIIKILINIIERDDRKKK
jgi:hypothetical protein